MGYRVEYGPISERTAGRTGFRWQGLLTFLFLVLTLFGTSRFWPEGKAVLDRLISLPGWDHTRQAMEMMAAQLRSGEPVQDAVTTFCRDVLALGLEYAP